jgi:hypothetical protein
MVDIYAKWGVSMIKTLWNIYIKQKTRNLTRIPIFAMIGGVRMCEFCCKIGKLEKIKQGAFKGGYYPEKNETQIVEFESAFHLFFGCSDPFMSGIGIEDIKFCPMCGRKLV